MKVSAEQLLNGIVNYADNEVINHLPTLGKWMLGAGIGMANSKVNDIVYTIIGNPLAKSIGIVDEDGMIDVDLLTDNLKASASKYGKLMMNVPLVGQLSFSERDVDSLRDYITK